MERHPQFTIYIVRCVFIQIIMKIAIKFGDNDFGNCFLGVLKTLLNAYRHTETLPTDKIELCNIINGLSSSCYLLFQHYKL